MRGKYRIRTWLRGRLPWSLAERVPKGEDCGAHEWYRQSAELDACYHCRVTRRHEVMTPADKLLRTSSARRERAARRPRAPFWSGFATAPLMWSRTTARRGSVRPRASGVVHQHDGADGRNERDPHARQDAKSPRHRPPLPEARPLVRPVVRPREASQAFTRAGQAVRRRRRPDEAPGPGADARGPWPRRTPRQRP